MATEASFNGVRVKRCSIRAITESFLSISIILFPRLDDEGGSDDVYKHPVTVKAEYDPKVRFVKLKSYSLFFFSSKAFYLHVEKLFLFTIE